MKHQIAHDLDESTAKLVADRAFESYQKRFVDYQPRMKWVSDKDATIEFNVKGLKLAGSIGIPSGYGRYSRPSAVRTISRPSEVSS